MTPSDILDIIPSSAAVLMGLIKPEYIQEWRYVAIMRDGSAYAVRRCEK